MSAFPPGSCGLCVHCILGMCLRTYVCLLGLVSAERVRQGMAGGARRPEVSLLAFWVDRYMGSTNEKKEEQVGVGVGDL